MFEEIDMVFWIKFFVLYVPFVIFIFIFSPSLKWSILFSISGIVGIGSALMGKGLRRRS